MKSFWMFGPIQGNKSETRVSSRILLVIIRKLASAYYDVRSVLSVHTRRMFSSLKTVFITAHFQRSRNWYISFSAFDNWRVPSYWHFSGWCLRHISLGNRLVVNVQEFHSGVCLFWSQHLKYDKKSKTSDMEHVVRFIKFYIVGTYTKGWILNSVFPICQQC
jgi:hypothetical protein